MTENPKMPMPPDEPGDDSRRKATLGLSPVSQQQQQLNTIAPAAGLTRTVAPRSVLDTAELGGATWIDPVRRDRAVEFPGVWIRRTPPRKEGHPIPRSRAKKLLDRLCAVDRQVAPPRAVVVVAHPDDEAIGVGARLCWMSDATIVHVTDGAPRDPLYSLRKGFANREAYARSRQDELTAALKLMGIGRERSRCFDVVDGEATDHLLELTFRLVDLFDAARPEIAITHPYEGGHTDHDAAAFAVHLAADLLRREGAPAPAVVELTSYHLYRGVRRVGEFLPVAGLEERTVLLDARMQKLKQEMYDCFESQRACLAAFRRDRERFRIAPRYNFTQAPHAGPLLYERASRTLSGARWRATAAHALAMLRSGRAPSKRAA